MKQTSKKSFLITLILVSTLLISCKKKNNKPDAPTPPYGKSFGRIEAIYTFSSSATDPDEDSISIRFNWGDGDTSDWSSYVPSGETVKMSHSWSNLGTYYIEALAKDINGAISYWSIYCEIIISANSPPDIPYKPIGPDSGLVDTSYSFGTHTFDTDGDSIAYQFDWGDGDTSDWSNFAAMGFDVYTSKSWLTTGTYSVKARAKDNGGSISGWSEVHQITIYVWQNSPPQIPSTPSGPSIGYIDTIYTFLSSTTDPDGDSIAIRFDWADGDTSDWSNFVPSGQTVILNHSWSNFGFYYVKAQAKDTAGNTSDWSSEHQIEISRLKWRYQTGSVQSSPAIGSDGTIYVGSDDNNLYALNPDGSLKWFYTTAYAISSSPAIGSDGSIFFGSNDEYLYALHPDGSLKWRYLIQNYYHTSPGIGPDGTIYIVVSNYLYAINPDGSFKWEYRTGGGWSSPAIGSDSIIYVGSAGDNYLYALNPNGSLKWRYQTGNGIYSSPAIGADGTIYVGSNDNNLYALNPDGSLKWLYQTGSGVVSSPAIGSDGSIYVGSSDSCLYAINPDGSLKWRYQTTWQIETSPTICSEGTIYIGSLRYLYALNSNGTLNWRYDTQGWIQSSPTISSDGTIYFGSDDIYALYGSGTLANTPWPKFRHDLKNTGRIGGGR
jgi:outer membrane protein assembly factor BamB